jgi:hypothetical protein
MFRSNRPLKNFVVVLALFVGLSATAVTPDNPYYTIVERNAFRLSPPPTNAPAPNPAELQERRDIKFTGITGLSGQKRAWFMIPPKPGETAPLFINLMENQRSGIIEVVKIMEESGEVKVLNSGREMTLSFASNGLKANSVPNTPGGPQPMPIPGRGIPPPIVAPGNPINPRGAMMQPGAQPSTVANTTYNPGGYNGAPGGGPAYNNAQTTLGNNGLGGITPQPQVYSGNVPNVQVTSPNDLRSIPPRVPTVNNAPNISPEEQAAQMEIDARAHQQQIQNRQYPPLPFAPRQ